jgi:hypothetical protein
MTNLRFSWRRCGHAERKQISANATACIDCRSLFVPNTLRPEWGEYRSPQVKSTKGTIQAKIY